VVTLAVRVMRNNDTIPDVALTRTVGAWLREYVHLPPSVGALLYPYTSMNERSPGWAAAKSSMHEPPVDGELSLDIARDGTLKRVHWFLPTLDSASNAEILAAIRIAEANGRFRELQGSKPPVSELEVQFVTDQRAGDDPIARLHADRILISSQARMLSSKPPKYPEGEHGDGRGRFTFIVDERGSVVPTTIQALEATSGSFVTAGFDALRQAVFAPARAGACPVKERVTMNLVWKLAN
jgi:hypothetical protein